MSRLTEKLLDLENAIGDLPEMPDVNYRKMQSRARQLACMSIRSFVKNMLLQKYNVSGLKTDKGRVVELINLVKVFYSSKKGVVVGLIDGLPEQRYKQFVALNAGAVHSKTKSTINVRKGKSKLKTRLLGADNISQKTENYSVTKAYKFFDFTPTEKAQIEQRFLEAFNRIFERMQTNG